MNYEEFKKELLHNAGCLQEAEGKRVIIVERGSLAEKSSVKHMTAYLNLYCCGLDYGAVQEDFLLVSWHRDGRPDWRCWTVRECFERYQDCGWPGVLPGIKEGIRSGREEGRGSFFTCGYEACRAELIVRPFSEKRCGSRLNDSIFWKRGNLVLVLYGVLRITERELMTVRITREMAGRWAVRDNTLLTQALFRTEVLLPPRLHSERDGMGGRNLWEAPAIYGVEGTSRQRAADTGKLLRLTGGFGAACVAEEGIGSERSGLRLTNSLGVSGAAAFFYPGVKERLSLLLGGDYYAAFPSAHEARVYPVCYEAVRRLMAEIHEGRCQYDEEELLTDSIYRYSCERQELIEI